MPFKPPLRMNGEVSPGNPSPFGLSFSPDLYSPPPREGLTLTENRAPKCQLSPSTILEDITSETVTAPSSRTPAFTPSASTQEISGGASQPRRSSTPALPSDGAISSNPFRYTSETEAEIRDAVLEANYLGAYQLFDPSECLLAIAGDEVTHFVSEHPDKATTTGRKASRLWVCQATATWAADGTVTYAPAACGVACTSRDISIRHVYTKHLAKARG
jgi:hypothetical protein